MTDATLNTAVAEPGLAFQFRTAPGPRARRGPVRTGQIRVAAVSGSWPPHPCGVGHYAEKLVDALRRRDVDVRCVGASTPGSTQGGVGLVRSLAADTDVIHIQYPTMGYGRSLMPALLPLLARRPVVVTIHEFSSYRWVRRPWFATFAHCVEGRIFTSEREREAFTRVMRPRRGLDLVVPIASNIPRGKRVERRPGSICHFGLITPGKGIETFLDLADLCRDRPALTFTLIGAVPEMYRDYAAPILARARSLHVDLQLDRSEAQVADLLSAQAFAYMPFPLGATPARGSLLAALRNDVVVLTTHSEITPPALRDATVEASDPAQALRQILRLGGQQPDDGGGPASIFGGGGDAGWGQIAQTHIDFFSQILDRRAARR